MSGVPVVVAENGQGFPVKVVESGAPVLTVATNGSGAPIVLSDRGTPFIVEGLVVPPVNTAAPVLTGPYRVGTAATVTGGTWTPASATITRQWEQATIAGGPWTAISGATGLSYTPTSALAGRFIRVAETGENDGETAVAYSNVSTAVQMIPANTAAPAITGTPQVGQTLTVSNGTWTGSPAPTYTRVWQMADAPAGPWSAAGSTATTLVLTATHVDKYIRATVTATNAAGSASASSAATAAVTYNFAWAEISMTAGTDGVQWIGYSDGGADRPQPAFGSISAQPTAVTDLLALYDDMNSNVYLAVFAGDYVSQMDALALNIGGSALEPFEAELINGNTWLRYNGIGDLTDGAMYEVSFG